MIRRLAHEPFGHRPTTLLIRVRRYKRCGCGRVWRQDTTMAALMALIDFPQSCSGNFSERHHWHAMEPKQNTRATTVIISLDAAHLVVVGPPLDHRKQERARAQCLEQLYWRLGELGVTQVFLEQRTKSLNHKDLQLVNTLQIKKATPEKLRVDIAPPSTEPMLWIPDQILGALGDAQTHRGSWLEQYRGAIEQITIVL